MTMKQTIKALTADLKVANKYNNKLRLEAEDQRNKIDELNDNIVGMHEESHRMVTFTEYLEDEIKQYQRAETGNTQAYMELLAKYTIALEALIETTDIELRKPITAYEKQEQDFSLKVNN